MACIISDILIILGLAPNSSTSFFLKIYLRERERAHMCSHKWGEGQRENLQADSLSMVPNMGLESMTHKIMT